MMKGLNFNLRTLFVVTALLAVIVYVTWRVSHHRPVGDIPLGMFAVQVVQDDEGLLFTITASTEPIKSLVVELKEEHPNRGELLFATGLIPVEPCERKRLRVQRNPGKLPSVEMQELLPIVRLPAELGNWFYTFHDPYNKEAYQHLGFVGEGKPIALQNERGQIFRLTILINQTTADALLP